MTRRKIQPKLCYIFTLKTTKHCYKTKHIEKDLNKCREVLCSMKDNSAKMLLLKAIYRVNAIPIKISGALFLETDKFILKFIWNCEGVGSKS